MKKQFLGDSYDILKRFWAEVLEPVAPLYAHPKFVPISIRDEYERLTRISILGHDRPTSFGILLDPDTGIPLPAGPRRGTLSRYAYLEFIAKMNEELQPRYIICFDQAHHRSYRDNLDKQQQLLLKVDYLSTKGIHSFYYLSHAPFLFMSESAETLAEIQDVLISSGIPKTRMLEAKHLKGVRRLQDA